MKVAGRLQTAEQYTLGSLAVPIATLLLWRHAVGIVIIILWSRELQQIEKTSSLYL